MIIKLIREIKQNFFLDKYEKNFIKNYVNKSKKTKSKVIFVYIAPSYYHLLHLAYLTKCTKFSEYEVVGIYNCDLMPKWKKGNYFIEFLVFKKKEFFNFFFQKKWILLYRAIGINKFYDLI